mmetsp:Transcript_28866/g.96023  ORF Transcript_28866/g.96023 Transcript_28866/m.96023 type:complete len:429 (+) Transcript_28866:147-1433(+)|eukprot:CAMPEP_0204187470 /NCGR_PEP_ID=MMETSP0361-20130328/56823_1 /ASSEMBLY_ACC=CAM_ASM_000343 /TAXON_ID=268821 /ORGANISM="Scrippsiella Hangoei, Strain SHTV-5" /LENGTH=428 /DNA_ID=CAMNT_0051147873 /DNA_START=90 /DNA_END=1376 /DNA_ORIENTATION=+
MVRSPEEDDEGATKEERVGGAEAGAEQRRPPTAEEVYHGAKQRRARNALHEALTANNNEEVECLIETGDDLLVSQQTTTGCTPLMLMAMGHCDERLLWRLLERRAAVAASAAIRSKLGRRTAADYASEPDSKRGAEVISTLRALEVAEVERTAAFRCPECGDLVRKRSLLHFFWERAEKGEEDNALLRRFFARDCHRALLEPRCHQLTEDRQIRKELSESGALLEALTASVPELDGGWHIVDLCCGKSLTGSLAALRFPGLVVTAVDRLQPRFVTHLAALDDSAGAGTDAGAAGMRYLCLDVLHTSFQEALERRVREVGRPTAVLGMHLCGALSLRAIEAFGRLDLAHALALSPCCLPNKSDAASAPLWLFASKDGAAQYQAWSDHLTDTLKRTVPVARVSGGPVPEVLSPKNIVICGVKPLIGKSVT